MKPLIRSVRMLTAEIRVAISCAWLTQSALATKLDVSQRTINSRLQQMTRLGEVQKRKHGYGTTEYRLKA